MVRGATPDVVLTAVELLARGLDAEHPGAGDVVVVDVGGATTDVHSVVEVDPEDAGLAREVVATLPVSRTVEGDLGMRWSAVPTVDRGGGRRDPRGRSAAARRRRDAGTPTRPSCPTDRGRGDVDERASPPPRSGWRCAGTPAGSRSCYGPDGRVVERSGKDLREVDLLVGSGGVLRATTPPGVAARVLGSVTGEPTPRAAGSCRGVRGRSSTTTTCWRRRACSPPTRPLAAHALLARLRPEPS